MDYTDLKSILKNLGNDEKAAQLQRFFKTGKGEYGEGDKFYGVTVPQIRLIEKTNSPLSLEIIEHLLADEYHECRMLGVLSLVSLFKRAKKDPLQRKTIYDFYISHADRINNWDLVDVSAPWIVGGYLADKPGEDLCRFAQSDLLWLQRIAIVGTQHRIKKKDFEYTFLVAEKLLHHPHDLIHKAVGWMLREVGDADLAAERSFLDKGKRYKSMPRTMLRYAIEKFPEPLRQKYLKGEI